MSTRPANALSGKVIWKVCAASGTLNLNADGGAGSTLRITLGYAPNSGDSVKLIDNQGGTLIGQFVTSTALAYYGGQTYRGTVVYNGGDGNDVMLTLTPVPRATILMIR